MAEILSPLTGPNAPTQPRQIPERQKPRLPMNTVQIAESASAIRNGHLNLDVFSPVNQNGSFEFDRVLKSGEVYKRTRKTRWKRFYLVLRPNLLSIYKNSSEERLHKSINLSELNAVAYLKDPKGRRDYMFGLFSPSRNLHFQANSEKDARDWVELIRHEARIDEEEDEITYSSPGAEKTDIYGSLGNFMSSGDDRDRWEQERLGSSSPEPADLVSRTTTRNGAQVPGQAKQSLTNLEYSGNEHASFSDLSDAGPSRIENQLSSSLAGPRSRKASIANATAVLNNTSTNIKPDMGRSASQKSEVKADVDEERVIWHGYLLCLKSKGGVRQWKKLWGVLRSKNLSFYKNEEEYSAHLIIPLSNIISAVEIDPVSRSKSHCMQIIVEETSYRFCAPSEESLARWLGALKSQLAKRKENVNRKA